MEKHLNGRQPQWRQPQLKTTFMEADPNGRSPQWRMNSMEHSLNRWRPQLKNCWPFLSSAWAELGTACPSFVLPLNKIVIKMKESQQNFPKWSENWLNMNFVLSTNDPFLPTTKKIGLQQNRSKVIFGFFDPLKSKMVIEHYFDVLPLTTKKKNWVTNSKIVK